MENLDPPAQIHEKMRFFDTSIVENPVENVEKLKLIHTVNSFGYVEKGNWDFAQKKKICRISNTVLQFFTVRRLMPRRESNADAANNEFIKKTRIKTICY